MEVHNTEEEIVIASVNDVFEILVKGEKTDKYCTCNQCRMDIICYVLNRIPPRYIVSNRGVSRVQGESIEHQQRIADIETLIHEGIKKVGHNQRPYFSHSSLEDGEISGSDCPVYNVPTIMGRVFDGNNFAPLSGIDVELLWNGKPVTMKNKNWQNPYHIVSNTEGTFSFWPAPDMASGVNKHKNFEYNLKVAVPGFETLNHFFKVPVASEIQTADSFSLKRTFTLPDLYMFPQGEDEEND